MECQTWILQVLFKWQTKKSKRTDSAFLHPTPQRRCRETFRSGTPRNNGWIKKQKLRVLAGPDLHKAPSQYSIKCKDRNENQSELEAEHQWKAGGVRKRRSAPSSDARRQRACMCSVVKGHLTEMNSTPSATNTVVFQKSTSCHQFIRGMFQIGAFGGGLPISAHVTTELWWSVDNKM